MDYLVIVIKTLLFYGLIMLFYRIMGKREIGELRLVDLVVSMLLSNIVAGGIEGYDESIFLTIIPIAILVLLQVIMSKLSFKYSDVRKFVDGEPSIIINRGKVNFSEMLRQRYNLDDLLVELRGQGIKSIEEVDYAVLEVSGKLSVFEKGDDNYPLPLILDGKIERDTLFQIGKDEDWLYRVIKDEKYELKDIFYGFYKDDEIFLIKNQNK